MPTAAQTSSIISGFTRNDLLVVIVVTMLLAGLGAVFLFKAGAKAKSTGCLHNLKQLGAGMAIYAESSQEKLPFGFVHFTDQNKTSWDGLIQPLIRAAIRGPDLSQPAPPIETVGRLLLCPSDPVPPVEWGQKSGRRTYSMPAHTMFKAQWPPDTNNATGVGLWWASYSGGQSSTKTLSAYSNGIPSIRTGMILEPAATLLLTEQVRAKNILANSVGATIKYTGDHLDEALLRPEQFHGGRINYLMVDGHVETLLPAQTVGHTGQTGTNISRHLGMWTIRAGD